ncbi:hypothetical protein EK904_000726 [Melospiza melodia maxima]|nr:hypothetical protein EK904_000726 [Melospiza melodia maxima]
MKALLNLETTVGACRNRSRVGSRGGGVLVLSFCVHPRPSLLPAELLAAVQECLCEGCPHSSTNPLGFEGKSITGSLCHRRAFKKNKQKLNKNTNQNVAVEEIAFAIQKQTINPRKTRKSLVPFAAPFVTPCPFLNDQKWCKCRCSEWQEHHDLGHVPPALPNPMQGRLCWASCCSQQGLALSPPWQEHPTGRYIRKAGDKAHKWWLKGPALCVPQRCCRAQFVGWFLKGYEEDFPQGIPQDFMPCGSNALIGCARGSLPRPCTSHWRLFPLFVFQDVPWKNGFGISVHYWDTIWDSGLFCSRHCPRDVC